MMRPLKTIFVANIVGLLALGTAGAITPEQVEIPNSDGKLRALLYRPTGPGPFPVVIGLHGCGGIIGASGAPGMRYPDWGERLASAGIAVLYPDSFGSRGLGSQCSVRVRTVRAERERVADVESARRWLQSQTWTMPDRVSLMGWSNGAIFE